MFFLIFHITWNKAMIRTTKVIAVLFVGSQSNCISIVTYYADTVQSCARWLIYRSLSKPAQEYVL